MFLGKTPHELQSLSLKPQHLGLGRSPGDHRSHPSFPVATGGDRRPWGLWLAESSQSLLSQNPQGHTAQGTRTFPKARKPARSGQLRLAAASPGRLCQLQLHTLGSSPEAPCPGLPPLWLFAPGFPPSHRTDTTAGVSRWPLRALCQGPHNPRIRSFCPQVHKLWGAPVCLLGGMSWPQPGPDSVHSLQPQMLRPLPPVGSCGHSELLGSGWQQAEAGPWVTRAGTGRAKSKGLRSPRPGRACG